MATTNIESVPITILSRCQRFDFKKFTLDELQHQINYVCTEEGIEITSEAAMEIAYISEGGMRDALSLLDQLSSISRSITIENILSSYGSISNVFIQKLLGYILEGNAVKITEQFEQLKSSAADYKIFIKKLIQELVNYAIRLKSEYLSSNLSYEQVKNLIFELNECMNRTNINIDPYILIELVVLNYISVEFKPSNSEEVQKKEQFDESQTEKVELQEKENDISEVVVENTTGIEEDERALEQQLNELKKVRINNCFCGAKKEYLMKLKNQWNELASSPIPDDILNLLVDTNIVAASNDYAILVASLSSTASLINRRIFEINEYLCEFFDTELKLIALSDSEWSHEKQVYIDNLHSGVTYQLLEEKLIEIHDDSEDSISSIEKIAQDVFNHDKIEIV